VPSEAIAQRERVLHAVRRHRNAIDHLGLDLLLLVRAEKGVVHKVAVVARNVGGRPDGIQGLQVGLRHEPEGPTTLLSAMTRFRLCRTLAWVRGEKSALAVRFFLKPLLQSLARPLAPFFQYFQFYLPQ